MLILLPLQLHFRHGNNSLTEWMREKEDGQINRCISFPKIEEISLL